jgi:glycosyltransferase involved in cell wall biosynthesis
LSQIDLSLIVPAYNEEARLGQSLQKLKAWQLALGELSEILVVDDGSRDRTAEVVRAAAGEFPNLRLLSNPGNRGKGYSVRHGMLAAKGEWLLFSDADLSTPLEEYGKLRAAAIEAGALGAIGSRALNRKLVGKHQPWTREAAGRAFNFVMRSLTGLPYADTQCGFKLFRRDAAREVFSRQTLDGFSFDVEILFIAKRLGLKVVEVPVRWFDAEGSKVTLRQGVKSFEDLMHIRRQAAAGAYDQPSKRS